MESKKKILYWGPYSGHVGTIRAQVNSAFAMRKYGEFDVVLIRVHSEFSGMEEELQDKDIRLLDLGLSKYFPGLEQSVKFARRPYMLAAAIFGFIPLILALRNERPDMVVLSLITVPALVAIKLANISTICVVSVQGYPHFLGIKGEYVPLWKRIENRIRKTLWNKVFCKADYILTMTKLTRKRLIKNMAFGNQQVQVIENPVIDSKVLSGKDKAAPHVWCHQTTPLIVGVGRLTRQKGFDVLIESLVKLRNVGFNANLIILGEGEERSKLQEMINQSELEDNIVLLGHKSDPYPYIAHADLFVLSSRWEDPGHAVIEAAALNVPIVTTDCPSGPSDLVGHGSGGWVCRNGDSDDMAEKIRDALIHPNPDKLMFSSMSAERYTLNSHFKAMNALLEKNIR